MFLDMKNMEITFYLFQFFIFLESDIYNCILNHRYRLRHKVLAKKQLKDR